MFSRRAVLRAGLAGAAALGYGGAVRPPAASAAAAVRTTRRTRTALAPGVYPFNQEWLFGGVYVAGAEAPGHPETGFAPVTLPHTVTPLSWGDWDPATWEQIWVYRKHLSGSATAGRRLFVDFQGVMTNATVFLGGRQIAAHRGGYLPWSVELTPHLVAGDNVLAVVVDARWLDVPPDGGPGGPVTIDYLEPGGIYRDVALRVVPVVFISDLFAKPANVLSASPSVDVQLTIDAAVGPAEPVTIAAELLDGTERLASAAGALSIHAPGMSVASINITRVANITLWSPDTPKLYQVRATVTAGGVSHTMAVNIGFRQATFAADGFYLNGERLEIFGLNRHQLFPYTGMAAPARLQARDAETLRNELNCNMVRCSHYPQSPAFLDACDELGLMVWEEPPGWQYVGDVPFQDLVLANVHDMVVRDRNRPSVIVWATRPNETLPFPPLYEQTRQLAHSLDGSRQTSGAMDVQSTTAWDQDVFAYDDYHAADGNATLEPPVPGVPYLVTEAVGALDGPPLYRWVDTEATLATQARMHAQVHEIARSDPAYAGLLGWAGIDYASLNSGNRVWHGVKWPGVLDTFRVPKPGAAFYRSQVAPSVRPVIAPVFFWDFGPGSPAGGPGPDSLVATNCDRLECFVDGTHVATGTPDRSNFASLAYPPVVVDLTVNGAGRPELRIDGYVAGQLVTSLGMSSDPAHDSLALTVEDASILGDGTDATRFTFRALDMYGNQRPYVTGDVSLALSGPATLVADNPFPFAAYGGVGGGFIRSQPGIAGAVTVTATHPTLGAADGQLTVTPAPPPVAGNGATGSAPPPVLTPLIATQAHRRPATEYVTRAVARAALATAISPANADRRIEELLRHAGYHFTFHAPSPGRLVIEWHHQPMRRTPSPGGRTAPILVADAHASWRQAGRARVAVRVTARGRSLLRGAARERLTVTATFTPAGESPMTATRVVTLRR